MSRLMSVALTEHAVRERRKTVTRRVGWRFLRVGDRLTLCRKVMGRKADEPLVRLAEVEVIDVRWERLSEITDADIRREGVDKDVFMPAGSWPSEHERSCAECRQAWWVGWYARTFGVEPETEVTRIEWRYLS